MLASMRQQKKDGVANYVWQLKSLPANEQWSGLAYGNGRFVAVSGGSGSGAPKLATFSTDNGNTWSTPSVIAPALNTTIYRLTFGNGIFVACGRAEPSNVVWTSPDGIAWTQRPSPVFARNISFANGLFFLTDSNGGAVSADAINWTAFSVGGFLGSFSNVAYGNSVYVASNATNYIYSTTGASWSALQTWSGGAPSLGPIAYGNGFFLTAVSGGAPGIAKKSFDGFTFLNRSMGSNFGDCSGVVFTGSKFVLVNSGSGGRAFVTADGESYVQTALYPPSSSLASSPVYANGVVMMLNSDPQFYGLSSAVYVMEIS